MKRLSFFALLLVGIAPMAATAETTGPLLRDSLISFEADGHAFSKKHFLYDDNNRQKAVKWFQKDDADQWDLFDEQDTTYNASGKLQMVAARICDHGITTGGKRKEFSYNASGLLEQICQYNLCEEDSFLTERCEYTYDENNLLKTEVVWSLSDQFDFRTLTPKSKTEYWYDASGNVIEYYLSHYYDNDWSAIWHATYAYDAAGRKVENFLYKCYWGIWYNYWHIEWSYEEPEEGVTVVTQIYSDGDDSPEGWHKVEKMVETHYASIPDYGSLRYEWVDGQWVFPSGVNIYIELMGECYLVRTVSYDISVQEEVKDMSGRLLSSTDTSDLLGTVATMECTYNEDGSLKEQLSKYSSTGGHSWTGDYYTYTFDPEKLTRTCLHATLKNEEWNEWFVESIEYFAHHATGIEALQTTNLPSSCKCIKDGRLMILNQNRCYNLNGIIE